MRLLHTSDWHLGQNFFGFSRQYEHQQFLDWLLVTLKQQSIDVLLIAGDIFDTANPPSSAQQQFYNFLCAAKLSIPHLQVVIIAGNHDSPTRLEVPTPFLAAFDMVVIGQVNRQQQHIDLEKFVIPLRNAQKQIEVWCLAVPFLRPSDVPKVENADDAYLEGIATLYAQVTELARSQKQAHQALIAMGHCHIVGGQISQDSERKLVMGGVEMLSSTIFSADTVYVALGHLHLAQAVGSEHIRYSGTPLPMSFSEIHYPHQVMMIEINNGKLQTMTPLLVPRSVPLQRIPPEPQPIEQVLALLEAQDWPSSTPDYLQPYLQVRVLLDKPEPSLRSKIEQVLENKGVRLVKIESSYKGREQNQEPAFLSLEEVQKIQPDEVFLRLYQQKYGNPPDTALLNLFRDLLNQYQSDEQGAVL
jgi:DNA repair protein SbcD/Mre11